MSDEKQIKASQAQSLLDDPILAEAWDRAERDLYEALLSLPIESKELYADYIGQIKALRNVRANLKSLVFDGQEASVRARRLGPRG